MPATIGVRTPNPHIKLAEWNLKVVTEPLPLKKSGTLIVGVNSFGFGGSNAHVIVESEPLRAAPLAPLASLLPIIVSARDSVALAAAASDLAGFLGETSAATLYDLSLVHI